MSERCPHGVWYDRTGGHDCPDIRAYAALKDERNKARREQREIIRIAQENLYHLGPDE